MKAAAPQLSIEQIDSLFDHGVEPDSYRGFASADPKLSIEEINSLRDHGVKPEYYRSMSSVDPHLSIEHIDGLFDHGVEPDSYKGFASVDSKLSIEEINSLRDHGVKAEYYRSLRSVDPISPSSRSIASATMASLPNPTRASPPSIRDSLLRKLPVFTTTAWSRNFTWERRQQTRPYRSRRLTGCVTMVSNRNI
jgi:hypothetical protein